MPAFAKGRLAWGLCQRCGLRFYLRELVLDGYYPNIRVCTGCYDPPQPQERLAVVSDPVALWKPAVDTYLVPPPFLTAVVAGATVVLHWTSIMDNSGGNDQGGHSHGPYTSQGYEVWRSSDGITFAVIATFLNTPDEFGALAVETLTYTDMSPPLPNAWYYIRGWDVNETAQNG